MLIALFLQHWKLLSAPLLYLSLHFNRRRPDYYRLLNEVRRTGAGKGLLESLGILRETTGRKRDRAYRYAGYLDRLRVGTELIAPGRRESR